MAEEEKNQTEEVNTESQQVEAPDVENQTGTEEVPETPESPAEDWETKYKSLQGEYDQVKAKVTETEQLLDTISPHVNWNEVHKGPETNPEGFTEDDSEEYVSKAEINRQIGQLERKLTIERLTNEFRQENPELRPYEELVGFHLLNSTDKRKPLKSRMADAVKMTKDFIEAERTKGAEATKKELEKKKAEAAAMGGLSSAGSTTPKKPNSEGQSYSDYIAERKAQSRKARGLA